MLDKTIIKRKVETWIGSLPLLESKCRLLLSSKTKQPTEATGLARGA